MHRPIAAFFVALFILSPVVRAADGDVVPVLIPYTENDRVQYRAGLVRKLRDDDKVAPTTRDGEPVKDPPKGSYILLAAGDPNHNTLVTDAEYARLCQLRDRYAGKGPRPETVALFTAHRTTGGYSAARVVGVVFHPGLAPGKDGLRRQDLYVGFSDFVRVEGKAHGDPVKGERGFTTITYKKPLTVDSVKGTGAETRAVISRANGGNYDFLPLSLPKPNQFPPPSEQRFILDFGRNPLHVPSDADSSGQLVYRVYVARVEGNDAIVIRPDSLQDLQNARKGQKVTVSYYRVPLAMLRVAPEGKDGDALLKKIEGHFNFDMHRIANMAMHGDDRPRMTPDDLFRANAFTGGRLETVAGVDARASLAGFSRVLDIEEAMALEQAKRQRPAEPGNTERGLRPPGACGQGLAGLN